MAQDAIHIRCRNISYGVVEMAELHLVRMHAGFRPGATGFCVLFPRCAAHEERVEMIIMQLLGSQDLQV
jgi:hypothetical protein